MVLANNKKTFKDKWNSFWGIFWGNKWYPFLALFVIFSIVLIVVFAYTNNNGGFLHMNSDDLIQYYPYVSGFFDKIKSGTLSFYDKNLFGGVSFFSAAYYIPLDIFTLIALLLSFFIDNETAYSIMNFMRPVCGALLLYYVLSRKLGLKASFLAALILFAGGTTETYYIFPVYLGICFYAPLGMLLIDLCIEKKGYYYLLLPIYAFLVILYDFYIAYMLLAFTSIYFVAIMYASLGDSPLSHKMKFFEFFKRFFEYLFFVLLGVLMGAFFLMPSALYIVHQSSRDETSLDEVLYSLLVYPDKFIDLIFKTSLKDKITVLFDKSDAFQIESYWFFNNERGTIVNFSLRHYFTQWANLFIPNDPHQLCLVEAGDYVREHASMYAFTGGFIYLIYFFFLSGKYEGRLKFFVLLMNILLCIPLFCVIFGFNTAPYLRWFFIPYFLNLYAIAIAMDKNKLSYGKSTIGQHFALWFTVLGLLSLLFVLITSPNIFIHYNNSGDYFYLLLIPSIILVGLYLIVLLLSMTFKALGKDFLHGRAVPILMGIEFIFATVIIFANVDNTNPRYYAAKETNENRYNTMKEIYSYDEASGYRTNLYTIFGRETTNLNVSLGSVNFGRFFQSFYNTELNTCLKKFYDESSTSWSRSFNLGYNLISGPVFNTKYIITNENISLPEKYYTCVEKDNTKYYALKDDIPFIVYDAFMNETKSFNTISKQFAILDYGYLEIEEDLANELGISFTESSTISIKYKSNFRTTSLSKVSDMPYNYSCYDLNDLPSSMENYDAYYIIPNLEVRRLEHGFMYVSNEMVEEYQGLNQLHYNMYYGSDFTNYRYLFVETGDKSTGDSVRVVGYNYSIYDSFIEKQNTYTNKSFSLNKSEMKISVSMPDDTKARIIKTGYTYSSEWVIDKVYDLEGNLIPYETINIDGGFLGIVCPKGVSDVNITLKFTPEGLNTGLKLTLVGSIIYASILIPVVVIPIVKKKKRVVE